MMSGTGINHGGGGGINVVGSWTASRARDQWIWVKGINGCALSGVALDRLVSVIGFPHCYHIFDVLLR